MIDGKDLDSYYNLIKEAKKSVDFNQVPVIYSQTPAFLFAEDYFKEVVAEKEVNYVEQCIEYWANTSFIERKILNDRAENDAMEYWEKFMKTKKGSCPFNETGLRMYMETVDKNPSVGDVLHQLNGISIDNDIVSSHLGPSSLVKAPRSIYMLFYSFVRRHDSSLRAFLPDVKELHFYRYIWDRLRPSVKQPFLAFYGSELEWFKATEALEPLLKVEPTSWGTTTSTLTELIAPLQEIASTFPESDTQFLSSDSEELEFKDQALAKKQKWKKLTEQAEAQAEPAGKKKKKNKPGRNKRLAAKKRSQIQSPAAETTSQVDAVVAEDAEVVVAMVLPSKPETDSPMDQEVSKAEEAHDSQEACAVEKNHRKTEGSSKTFSSEPPGHVSKSGGSDLDDLATDPLPLELEAEEKLVIFDERMEDLAQTNEQMLQEFPEIAIDLIKKPSYPITVGDVLEKEDPFAEQVEPPKKLDGQPSPELKQQQKAQDDLSQAGKALKPEVASETAPQAKPADSANLKSAKQSLQGLPLLPHMSFLPPIPPQPKLIPNSPSEELLASSSLPAEKQFPWAPPLFQNSNSTIQISPTPEPTQSTTSKLPSLSTIVPSQQTLLQDAASTSPPTPQQQLLQEERVPLNKESQQKVESNLRELTTFLTDLFKQPPKHNTEQPEASNTDLYADPMKKSTLETMAHECSETVSKGLVPASLEGKAKVRIEFKPENIILKPPPKTPFELFCEDYQSVFSRVFVASEFWKLMPQMTKRWKSLPSEKKKQYEKRLQTITQRYKDAKAAIRRGQVNKGIPVYFPPDN